MKVALFQNDPRPRCLEKNADAVFSHFPDLSREKVDLLVLPEMWPYSPGDSEDFRRCDLWKRILKAWQELCRRYRMASAGGFPRFRNGKIYNSLYFIGREGEILAIYDKIHLFSPMGEKQRYTPGRSPLVVEFEGIRFGLSICYDLRFPELYRAERQEDAEVFLVPAQWPAERSDHFAILLRARALENLAYVIGVNRTGRYRYNRKTYTFLGRSAAFHPWGDPLWVSGETQGYSLVEIRKGVVTSIRRKFPVWEDRVLGKGGSLKRRRS